MDNINDHPFLAGCDIVKPICRSLFKKYGINFFSHLRVFKNKYYTGVMTNKTWAQHYLQNQYYNIDRLSYDLDKIESGVEIWSEIDLDDNLQKIYQDANEFGYGLGFSLIFKTHELCDFFAFTTQHNKSHLYQRILPHLDDFKRFVYHYMASLKNNQRLNTLYNKRYPLKSRNQNKIYKVSKKRMSDLLEKDIVIKRFYFSNAEKDRYLTYREVQCLKYLITGKLVKDVASCLGISTRTAESYIDTIKLKMDCRTLADIRERTFTNAYILTAIDLLKN